MEVFGCLSIMSMLLKFDEYNQVVDATIKRRHLFDRYSIVFPSFSLSQREKRGKHIGKRYDEERRNIEPGRHTEERWGQICDTIGTLRKDGVRRRNISQNKK